MDRARFFYKWFLGMLGDNLFDSWGRDLGNPARSFYAKAVVSPRTLEVLYSLWEEASRPVYQSVNYYVGSIVSDDPGKLVALEKIFIDLDGSDLDAVKQDTTKLVDHLRSFGEPLVVFSGKKGFHVYLWLPQIIEDTELYRWIVKVLKLDRLSLKYLDTKVLEPARIARVPYTLHQDTKQLVQPLDTDLKPIAIESFSLDSYLLKPVPSSVIEEAKQLREAYEKIEAARKFWRYMEYLRNPSRVLRATNLPNFIEWLLKEAEIPEGYRNNAAFIIATWLASKGMSFEEVLDRLLEWNRERCRPPLPEKEVLYVVKSVFKHRYRPVSRNKASEWLREVLRSRDERR